MFETVCNLSLTIRGISVILVIPFAYPGIRVQSLDYKQSSLIEFQTNWKC